MFFVDDVARGVAIARVDVVLRTPRRCASTPVVVVRMAMTVVCGSVFAFVVVPVLPGGGG
jgi:hypothetical protein